MYVIKNRKKILYLFFDTETCSKELNLRLFLLLPFCIFFFNAEVCAQTLVKQPSEIPDKNSAQIPLSDTRRRICEFEHDLSQVNHALHFDASDKDLNRKLIFSLASPQVLGAFTVILNGHKIQQFSQAHSTSFELPNTLVKGVNRIEVLFSTKQKVRFLVDGFLTPNKNNRPTHISGMPSFYKKGSVQVEFLEQMDVLLVVKHKKFYLREFGGISLEPLNDFLKSLGVSAVYGEQIREVNAEDYALWRDYLQKKKRLRPKMLQSGVFTLNFSRKKKVADVIKALERFPYFRAVYTELPYPRAYPPDPSMSPAKKSPFTKKGQNVE